jgi:hypothetical protein
VAASSNNNNNHKEEEEEDGNDDDNDSGDDDDDNKRCNDKSGVANKKEFLQPFVFTAHATTKPPVFLATTDASNSELPSMPVNAVSGELKDDNVAMHVARWNVGVFLFFPFFMCL